MRPTDSVLAALVASGFLLTQDKALEEAAITLGAPLRPRLWPATSAHPIGRVGRA
jgi:hypothetical protein